MKQVQIFTDGACRGNPGPGGWGALLRYDSHEKELSGSEPLTTNNRMELLAAVEGIAALQQPCQIELTTDSQYVKKGMTEWLPQWKKHHWRKSDKTPVKNADLWQRLDEVVKIHQVSWHWVRGHNGHAENERADQLANKAIDRLLGIEKEGR